MVTLEDVGTDDRDGVPDRWRRQTKAGADAEIAPSARRALTFLAAGLIGGHDLDVETSACLPHILRIRQLAPCGIELQLVNDVPRPKSGEAALRYYERIGLLPPPTRRASGYRVYDRSYETRLAFIGRAKRLGLSLEQIREILALRDAGREPCAHVLGVVDHQIARVDDAIEQLAEFRKQLRSLRRETAARRTGRAAVCRIIEHGTVGDGGAVLERWQAKHKS